MNVVATTGVVSEVEPKLGSPCETLVFRSGKANSSSRTIIYTPTVNIKELIVKGNKLVASKSIDIRKKVSSRLLTGKSTIAAISMFEGKR